MQVFGFSLLILSLSVSSVLSIRCHDCNSKFEDQCKDPFKDFPLSELNCESKLMHANNKTIAASFCRKTYQKVNEEVRIIRSCGYISDTEMKGGCRKSNPSKGVELYVCECLGDLCNGSYKIQGNAVNLMLISTVVIICKNIFSII